MRKNLWIVMFCVWTLVAGLITGCDSEDSTLSWAKELAQKCGSKVVFVREGAQTGQGTYRHPFGSLVEVENNSSPGDVIVVLDSENCLDGGIALKPRQSLIGFTQISCQREVCEVAEARSQICNTNDVDPRYEGDAIRLADDVMVYGIHINKATRFGVYGKNVDNVLIQNSLIEHTVSTDVPSRNFLKCELQVRDDYVEDGVAILKMPDDELGCWNWPAAFPGTILSSDRSQKLYFSNVAASAIGLLANTGTGHARIQQTIIRDFTAGLVTGSEPGPFGYAEGAEAILLSTDEDAEFHLDVEQVNIRNSPGITRVADCTYAAIFTVHHDTSRSYVNIRDSLIQEIGGCDGINAHIGVLPGVTSDEGLVVRLQDDGVEDEDITRADDPDLGPKHKAHLSFELDRVHVINPFNPIVSGDETNPNGQDPDNPANQYTDAFEPTLAEGAGSSFDLTVRNSTMTQNAGNGLEIRLGPDSIENITTPNLSNVSVTLVNNCIFDNARSDDLFRPGSESDPNYGRDGVIGRDFHQVHLFLPENPQYVIKAQNNYWGRPQGLLFDSDAEVTDIIAIENDTLAPGSSSSYTSLSELFTVFDASQPCDNAAGCFQSP